MPAANFWSWEGRVSRASYSTVGVLAFALKFLGDWLVVTKAFHRPWSLLNYWRPFGAISGIHSLSLENRFFAGTMLKTALAGPLRGMSFSSAGTSGQGVPSSLSPSRTGGRIARVKKKSTLTIGAKNRAASQVG